MVAELEMRRREQDDGRAVLEPAELVALTHVDVAGVLGRPAGAEERRIAHSAYDDFARYYSAHPDDARKFLNQGEHKPDPALPASAYAALTMVASQLFNLDEALNQ